MLIELLTSIVSAFNHTKCMSLSNKKCMTQPTLINLHPNEYRQELHYYPFSVNLDRCAGICNTLDDLSNNVCVSNETEDLNLHVFNMITRIKNQENNYLSCKCECKFGGRKYNLNQNWNNDKRWCECKNPKENQCKKGYFWNPAKCSCENDKYAKRIGNSAVTCNEVIEETKTIPPKSTSTNFYNLLAFLLITITLLISASIYLKKH